MDISIRDEIKKSAEAFDAAIQRYWGEAIKQECSYDGVLARAIIKMMQPLRQNPSLDNLEQFIKDWNEVWSGKPDGYCSSHPKWWDSDYGRLFSKFRTLKMISEAPKFGQS